MIVTNNNHIINNKIYDCYGYGHNKLMHTNCSCQSYSTQIMFHSRSLAWVNSIAYNKKPSRKLTKLSIIQRFTLLDFLSLTN